VKDHGGQGAGKWFSERRESLPGGSDMAVQAMYALKPTPCFLGGSLKPWGRNGVFMIVTVKEHRVVKKLLSSLRGVSHCIS